MKFFFTPWAVLFSRYFSYSSFLEEYILLFKPINSTVGLPAASSLNLPITFLFCPEKNLEDLG